MCREVVTAMPLTEDGYAPREPSQDDVGIVPLFTHLSVRKVTLYEGAWLINERIA